MPVQFSYQEVQAEYDRLGYRYPEDRDFSEEEIAETISSRTNDYYRYKIVATLGEGSGNSRTITSAQVKAFADLAALFPDAELRTENSQLVIRRDSSPDELREHALLTLKSTRDQEQHNAARESLEKAALANADGKA